MSCRILQDRKNQITNEKNRSKTGKKYYIEETFDISGLTDEEKAEADRIFEEAMKSGEITGIPELKPYSRRKRDRS